VNEIERTDKSNDMKLVKIDGNIVIVYKEDDKLLRINETRFETVRKEIAMDKEENIGNFGNILNWFEKSRRTRQQSS
jgi:hypothetical protein